MTSTGQAETLLERLFKEAELPRLTTAFYVAPKGPPESAKPYGVAAAIGLKPEDLSATAVSALEALESVCKESPDWLRFKWRLSAFAHVQDIFDATIQPAENLRTLFFQQYYFHFESRALLAESLVAGLNGLYIASAAVGCAPDLARSRRGGPVA